MGKQTFSYSRLIWLADVVVGGTSPIHADIAAAHLFPCVPIACVLFCIRARLQSCRTNAINKGFKLLQYVMSCG